MRTSRGRFVVLAPQRRWVGDLTHFGRRMRRLLDVSRGAAAEA
jgi:hypothetical protein